MSSRFALILSLVISSFLFASSCKLPGSKSKQESEAAPAPAPTDPATETLPPIEPLYRVDFDSEIMTFNGQVQRIGRCVAFTATAKAYLGHTIRVDRTSGFLLSKYGSTPSDLQIYATADCSGALVTEGRITTEASSTTMSFRMNTPGLFGLYGITSHSSGVSIGAIFFGPEIHSYSSTHSVNTNCNRRTITMLDASGAPLAQSPTDPTEINIGEFRMPGVVKFYDSEANCLANGTTGLLTEVLSGQSVTRLTLPPGATSFDIYPQSGGTPSMAAGFLVYAESTTASTNLTTVNTSKDLILDIY